MIDEKNNKESICKISYKKGTKPHSLYSKNQLKNNLMEMTI